MTCKVHHISLEILRIRARHECCGAAMFRELRFPPTVRKYPQARPYSARAGLFFLLDSVKAQRWNYLRLFSSFGALLSSPF